MHIAYMYYLANIKEINSQLENILYPNEQKEKEQPNRSEDNSKPSNNCV